MTEQRPMEPPWLLIARHDIGLSEIRGPATAPRIKEWLARLGAWWRDDETPWCGVALAGWMDEAGLRPPAHYYRALAWADWGVPAGIELGVVAVLKRVPSGGHVGIITGSTPDKQYIRLLGGNQGNRVSEVWVNADRVVALRKPGMVTLAPAPETTLAHAPVGTQET